MAHYAKFTEKRRSDFIEELSIDANVSRSADAVGISRRALYIHRDKDEDFRAEWEEAVRIGTEALIDECRRRAHNGVTEMIYHKGEIVGQKQVFSDTLAMFIIKAHRPEYRDKLIDMPTDGRFILEIDTGNSEHQAKAGVDDKGPTVAKVENNTVRAESAAPPLNNPAPGLTTQEPQLVASQEAQQEGQVTPEIDSGSPAPQLLDGVYQDPALPPRGVPDIDIGGEDD